PPSAPGIRHIDVENRLGPLSGVHASSTFHNEHYLQLNISAGSRFGAVCGSGPRLATPASMKLSARDTSTTQYRRGSRKHTLDRVVDRTATMVYDSKAALP